MKEDPKPLFDEGNDSLASVYESDYAEDESFDDWLFSLAAVYSMEVSE